MPSQKHQHKKSANGGATNSGGLNSHHRDAVERAARGGGTREDSPVGYRTSAKPLSAGPVPASLSSGAGEEGGDPLSSFLGVMTTTNDDGSRGSHPDLNHQYHNNVLEDSDCRFRANQREVSAARQLMDCCRIGQSIRNDNTVVNGALEDSQLGRSGSSRAALDLSGRNNTDNGSFVGDDSFVVTGPCFISPLPTDQWEKGGERPQGRAYSPPAGRPRIANNNGVDYESPHDDDYRSHIGTRDDGNILRMSCYRRGE